MSANSPEAVTSAPAPASAPARLLSFHVRPVGGRDRASDGRDGSAGDRCGSHDGAPIHGLHAADRGSGAAAGGGRDPHQAAVPPVGFPAMALPEADVSPETDREIPGAIRAF